MLAEARKSPLRIRFNYLASRYLIKNFSRCDSLLIKSFKHLKSISLNQCLKITACQTVPTFKRYIATKFVKSCIKRSNFVAAYLYPFPVTTTTAEYACVFAGADKDTSKEFILSQFQDFLHLLIKWMCAFTQMDPNLTWRGTRMQTFSHPRSN